MARGGLLRYPDSIPLSLWPIRTEVPRSQPATGSDPVRHLRRCNNHRPAEMAALHSRHTVPADRILALVRRRTRTLQARVAVGILAEGIAPEEDTALEEVDQIDSPVLGMVAAADSYSPDEVELGDRRMGPVVRIGPGAGDNTAVEEDIVMMGVTRFDNPAGTAAAAAAGGNAIQEVPVARVHYCRTQFSSQGARPQNRRCRYQNPQGRRSPD